MKQVIIFVICGILLCTGCFLLASCTKKPNFNNKKLIEFHYYTGGGMEGGYYGISLNKSNDNYKLTLEECEYNGATEISKTIDVEDDVILHIDEIARKYDMYNWSKLPEVDFFALDAPSTSIDFYFDDGESAKFGDRNDLPQGSWTHIQEILDYLENLFEN